MWKTLIFPVIATDFFPQGKIFLSQLVNRGEVAYPSEPVLHRKIIHNPQHLWKSLPPGGRWHGEAVTDEECGRNSCYLYRVAGF